MKAVEQRYEIGDLGLRDELDEVLVTRGQYFLHIPARENDSDDEKPICNQTNRAVSYKRKPPEVYPDGYIEWCCICLDRWGIEE